MGTVSRRRDKVVSTWKKSHSDDATLGIEGPLPQSFWVVLSPIFVEGVGTSHEAFSFEPRNLG